MLDLSAIADPLLTVVASVAATWGAMRSQVIALKVGKEASDKEISELKDRVTRLEERHDGLVGKLDGAVANLQRIADKLEALTIKIAGATHG